MLFSDTYCYSSGVDDWYHDDGPPPRPPEPPNETYVDVEGISILVATCLSLLGSASTFATFIFFQDMRSTSLTFAVWLGIASTGYGLMTFLKPMDDDDSICHLVAFVTTYFNLVAVFTTTVVAYGMLKIFSFRDSAVVPSHRSFNIIRKRYYFYVFGAPLIYAALPFTTNSYGKTENTLSCWILVNDDVQDASDAWRLTFFGFVILAVLFTSYVYISVFYKFTDLRQRGSETSNRIVEAIERVKWYPIILVVVYIVPFIMSVFSVVGLEIDDRLWSAFSISSLKMQGFLNAIAYGMTPLVRYRWRIFFFGIPPSQKGEDGVELPLSSHRTNSSSAPGHRKSSHITSVSTNFSDDT